MDETPGRRIALLMAALIVVYAMARIDSLRPVLANTLALGLPAVAIIAGVAPLRDGHPVLRAVAFLVAALLLVGTGLFLGPAFIEGAPAWPAALGAKSLIILGSSTILIEAWAAKRGLRTRFAGWTGIALGVALYLPSHTHQADPLGGVMASGLVGMLVGFAGLLLGELAVQTVRRHS